MKNSVERVGEVRHEEVKYVGKLFNPSSTPVSRMCFKDPRGLEDVGKALDRSRDVL